MNKRLTYHFFFALIITCFYTHSFAEPANLSLLKKEIRQYHDSGDYDREFAVQINAAERFLLEQIHYYHNQKKQTKLALVLDIDETSLTNYDKMALRDFAGNQEQIHQEILAANAPAIKATLNLYQIALNNGVDVFFVTGRVLSELDATKENLMAAGYDRWAGIYVRPEKYSFDSIVPFKSECRKQIESQGYTIIESIGDQYSDIDGGYALKGIKLPNPYYFIK